MNSEIGRGSYLDLSTQYQDRPKQSSTTSLDDHGDLRRPRAELVTCIHQLRLQGAMSRSISTCNRNSACRERRTPAFEAFHVSRTGSRIMFLQSSDTATIPQVGREEPFLCIVSISLKTRCRCVWLQLTSTHCACPVSFQTSTASSIISSLKQRC